MARISDFINPDPPRGTAPRIGQKPTRTRRAGRSVTDANNLGGSRRPVGNRSLRDTIVEPILDLNRRGNAQLSRFSNAVRDPDRLSRLVAGETREQFRNSGNVDLGLRRSVQRQLDSDINPGANPGVPVNTEDNTPGRDRVYRTSLGADPGVRASGNEYKAAATGRNPEDFHESVKDAGRGSPSGEVPRLNMPESGGVINEEAQAKLEEQIEGATRLGKYASQLRKIIEDPAGQKFLGQMAQAFTARDPNSAGFMLGQSAIDQAEGRMEGEELSRLIEGGDPANARRGIGQESRRAAQTQAFQNRESDRADIGVEQSERQLDQADRRIDQQDERIELERQRFEQNRLNLLEEQSQQIESMGTSEIDTVNEHMATYYLDEARDILIESDYGELFEINNLLGDPTTGSSINWSAIYSTLPPERRQEWDSMRAEFARSYDPDSRMGIPEMFEMFSAAKSEQQTTGNQQTGSPNTDESDMPTLTRDDMEQMEVGVPFIYGGTGRYSGDVFVKNEEGKFVPYTGGQ